MCSVDNAFHFNHFPNYFSVKVCISQTVNSVKQTQIEGSLQFKMGISSFLNGDYKFYDHQIFVLFFTLLKIFVIFTIRNLFFMELS